MRPSARPTARGASPETSARPVDAGPSAAGAPRAPAPWVLCARPAAGSLFAATPAGMARTTVFAARSRALAGLGETGCCWCRTLECRNIGEPVRGRKAEGATAASEENHLHLSQRKSVHSHITGTPWVLLGRLHGAWTHMDALSVPPPHRDNNGASSPRKVPAGLYLTATLQRGPPKRRTENTNCPLPASSSKTEPPSSLLRGVPAAPKTSSRAGRAAG